jgi:hypothetical protein
MLTNVNLLVTIATRALLRMILALTDEYIHVDCRAMGHPVQQGDKIFHVS